MGSVSPAQVSDGTTIDASDVNNPINTIANEFNGNIDNTNIKAAAAITGSKLADNSIDVTTKASSWDGWVQVTDTWTYASATTVTVPSDATTKYSVGDKVKFSNGSTKYFYITGVAATVLTLNGGSDYTVANSAITGVYYSKAETPLSFPDTFNYSPTWTNFTIGSGTNAFTFKMIGKLVIVRVKVTLSSSTMGTNPQFSVPVNEAATYGTDIDYVGGCSVIDTGTAFFPGWLCFRAANKIAVLVASAGGTHAQYTDITSTVPHTWANTDLIKGTAEYYAA